MKQTGQQAVHPLAERAALFYLLKFVEKQYSVLKPLLSADYLVLHFESMAYLNAPDVHPKKSYRDFYEKIFSTIETALQSPTILGSARIALMQFNQDANSSTASDMHFLKLQNIGLVAGNNQQVSSHASENIHDDIKAACAMTYLAKRWSTQDLTAALTLQQELRCLQAWLNNLRNQSWRVHTQLARQQLLCVEKSQFAKCFYQSPQLAYKIWQDLYPFCNEHAQDALKTIKDTIMQIEILITAEEEMLKKHPCARPCGKEIIYFHRNEIYYTLFPPTLKFQHSHALLPWVFSVSAFALYQLLANSLPVDKPAYFMTDTKTPWLLQYAIENMTHCIGQNSALSIYPHYKPFP